jgi:uncharacterized DUF497 family protein
LEYEWDPKKADRNFRKHGVDFVDAVIVFDDDAPLRSRMNIHGKSVI